VFNLFKRKKQSKATSEQPLISEQTEEVEQSQETDLDIIQQLAHRIGKEIPKNVLLSPILYCVV